MTILLVTKDLFEPFVKAGTFQSFGADITLMPGIRALVYTVGFIFVVMGRSEMCTLQDLTLAPDGNSVLLCEP